jgi:hypothetical protein
MKKSIITLGVCFVAHLLPASADSGIGWITYPGGKGPGQGKHVVLVSGDEEYRSEEALPMLAKILSERQGFKCTVLFSTDPDGTINPNKSESVGKPEAFDSADAIVTLLRFRKWPDAAMKHFDDAVLRGVPIVALRTSTHSFQLPDSSSFKAYNNFGKDVLGEGWVSHWGNHKSEATRGIIEPTSKNSPLLQGVADIFVTTDVYEAYPPADAKILVLGQVLAGMKPTDEPAAYQKKRATDQQTQDINSPMIPVAWQRTVKNAAGKTNKILCTTMGASTDLTSEDLRRLVVNGVLWGTDVKIPAKTDVTLVGEYKPTPYNFDSFTKNTKAEDYK